MVLEVNINLLAEEFSAYLSGMALVIKKATPAHTRGGKLLELN